jgi:hypothetical protein
MVGYLKLNDRPVLLDTDDADKNPYAPSVLRILQTRIPDVTMEDCQRVFEHCTVSNQKIFRGRVVVVLGEAARTAMALPPLFLHPQIIDGAIWRQIPHPNDLWFYQNEITMDLVALLLESLYLSWTLSEIKNVRV